jgi:hypothetical protein
MQLDLQHEELFGCSHGSHLNAATLTKHPSRDLADRSTISRQSSAVSARQLVVRMEKGNGSQTALDIRVSVLGLGKFERTVHGNRIVWH